MREGGRKEGGKRKEEGDEGEKRKMRKKEGGQKEGVKRKE